MMFSTFGESAANNQEELEEIITKIAKTIRMILYIACLLLLVKIGSPLSLS
jgi:hypothetical protein